MLEIGIGIFVLNLSNSLDFQLIVLIFSANDAVNGDGLIVAADANFIVLNFFDLE